MMQIHSIHAVISDCKEHIVEVLTDQRDRNQDVLGDHAGRIAGGIGSQYVTGEQQHEYAGKTENQIDKRFCGQRLGFVEDQQVMHDCK